MTSVHSTAASPPPQTQNSFAHAKLENRTDVTAQARATLKSESSRASGGGSRGPQTQSNPSVSSSHRVDIKA